MKLLAPNFKDIFDVGRAIRSFEGAWGSIDVIGKYQPSVDERQLWLMLNVTREMMRDLWMYSGMSTDESSSYQCMLGSHDHIVNVRAYKVKLSLLSSAWFGEVFLLFGGKQLYVGAAGGRYQLAMWENIRQFLQGNRKLHGSAVDAIATL